MRAMRVCVFGAGAVGGNIAVMLARAGADVSVLVRGATLQAARARGPELHTPDGVVRANVRASDDPRELGEQDAVLVTVKQTALTASAPAITALLGRDTPAVFLQNGIPWWYFHGQGNADEGKRIPELDPGDVLWNTVGPQRAVGGVTSSPCTVVEPGVVKLAGKNGTMVFGEPDGSMSPRLMAIAELFKAAGLPAEATPRIRDAIWQKLALNLGSGPLAVLAPVSLAALYAEEACVQARFRIQDEVEAIAAAMGCPVTVSRSIEATRKLPHVPSIGQDVAAGRKPELEAMFRAPLAMAREKGVATPTLDLLVALCTLKLRAAGMYP